MYDPQVLWPGIAGAAPVLLGFLWWWLVPRLRNWWTQHHRASPSAIPPTHTTDGTTPVHLLPHGVHPHATRLGSDRDDGGSPSPPSTPTAAAALPSITRVGSLVRR